MSRINEFLKRYLIFTKRLLLKKSFLTILLLVPLLVGAFEIAVKHGDSGIITVALAAEDPQDELAREIVADIMDDDNEFVRFVLCDSPSDATSDVETGVADVAWVFKDNLEHRIEKFVNHTHKNNSFVTVIQRESNNTFLSISSEKLNSVIYPHISRAMFFAAGKDKVSEVTDEELEELYSAINAEGAELFDFVYAKENGSDELSKSGNSGFLVSPLRGFLAIMVVLGGVAVAMFYMHDEAHGFFDRFPRGSGFSLSVAYHASAVITVSLAMLCAIFAMQVSRGVWYELATLAVYTVSVIGLSMCLRLALRDVRIFGAIAPVLIIVMVVVCPILYPAPSLPVIQYLVPTYYYLRSLTDVAFLWYMAAYGTATCAIAFLLHRFCAMRYRR